MNSLSIKVDLENPDWTAQWTMHYGDQLYGNAITMEDAVRGEPYAFDAAVDLIVENFRESYNQITGNETFTFTHDFIQEVTSMITDAD